jgi:shikimate dehydrogenase
MTSNYAVLGSPIAHSKSPVLHRAAFAASGIEASYDAHELAGGLANYVSTLDESWRGLSLTMPLKEEALDVAEQLHPLAISSRAANTLIRVSGAWLGYNTDVMGLQQAVANLTFQTVAILGNGATARSAAVAFEDSDLFVWARNSDRAMAITESYGGRVSSMDDALSCDLVVSTLPAGALEPLLGTSYDGVLLDVAYANKGTGSHFASSISGLEMLLWQAVGQQRLFRTGQFESPLEDEEAVVAAMRSALDVGEWSDD